VNLLRADDFNDPQRSAAQVRFGAFANAITDDSVARLSIWSTDSTIIYSDYSRLIGFHNPDQQDIKSVLRSGAALYTPRTTDENAPVQSNIGEFLDINIPITLGSTTVGAVEIHSVGAAVLQPVQREFQQIVVLITLETLLLLAALFFIVQRYVIRRLERLEASATRVQKGELSAAVPVGGADEIGHLEVVFNEMLDGLRRLEELRNEFVFVASHEIRSPVTAISWNLSLVEEAKDLPPGVAEPLREVKAANNRLVVLINDLLEVSRAEAGRLTIKLSAIPLRPAVLAAMTEVKAIATQKNITCTSGPDVPLPDVLADTARLQEVLVNLLSNAVKYGKPGGWVHITHDVDDASVVTHVADNGIGIPAKEQGKVFKKFFRSESDASRGIQGTGLGLFIIKQIIEKMGGDVSFVSAEGSGTTFSFRLSRADKGNR
jgi:signal transduction histidine kinase